MSKDEALKLALEALELSKDEALKLALEALEFYYDLYKEKVDANVITAIKAALAQPERDYERGFIDGMQKQMQSSVDKAVNGMTRKWVGLTDEERESFWKADQMTQKEWDELFTAIEAKLKDKNT